MADLVTHLATALLVKAATRGEHTATLAVGVVLPDLAARVPSLGLSWLRQRGLAIDERFIFAFDVLHMPLGMAALCVLVSLLFREDQRATAFWNLLGGCALHLGVDLLQRHLGMGYLLAWPFSRQDWELGWIGTEATVRVAPVLFPVAAAAWWWRQKR